MILDLMLVDYQTGQPNTMENRSFSEEQDYRRGICFRNMGEATVRSPLELMYNH
jgi:hypothetical protein